MDRGESRPAGGEGPSASADNPAPSSGSPSSPGIEALAAEAMAFDGDRNEESIDVKVQKALECPCLDDLKKGPCGDQFIDAFSCYLKSTKEEKGSDCVNPFIALQNCIKENKEAFIKEILEEEENDVEAEKSNLKVLPPAWSREPRSNIRVLPNKSDTLNKVIFP
ncbi:mitochondrial intermembrane space import and assembly protein 40 homolog [Phragmites australis]|uniref:mitochondrial intermembrane space import and assembly protein 40 homolog n=1 Tax=Phragmites australis TaxID=29695 RepID=UPI002D770FE8|nr:mitochondrial intermembrane space import and assembly protein 40 homolog [Phragmites australis]